MVAMKLPKLVKKALYTLALRRGGSEGSDDRDCTFRFAKGEETWFVEVYRGDVLYAKVPVAEERLPEVIRKNAPRFVVGDAFEFVGVGEAKFTFMLSLEPEEVCSGGSEFE